MRGCHCRRIKGRGEEKYTAIQGCTWRIRNGAKEEAQACIQLSERGSLTIPACADRAPCRFGLHPPPPAAMTSSFLHGQRRRRAAGLSRRAGDGAATAKRRRRTTVRRGVMNQAEMIRSAGKDNTQVSRVSLTFGARCGGVPRWRRIHRCSDAMEPSSRPTGGGGPRD